MLFSYVKELLASGALDEDEMSDDLSGKLELSMEFNNHVR